MSNRPLTEKQKSFCRCIVAGMSTKDAYLSSYNSKAKDNTAYVEAAKLLNDERIQGYIKTLSKPKEYQAQAQSLSARVEQIEFIKSRIEHCIASDDEQSLIRYTDMLNKIHGIYKEETKIEQNDSVLAELDNDKLIKLIG